MRYEDPCRDPRAELERLMDFLGLSTAVTEFDFRALGPRVFGNEIRLRADSEIRLDERWKSDLAPGVRAPFERIAGETNRALGYA